MKSITILVALSLAVIITLVGITPTFTQDFVDAKSTKKVHFTQTLSSYPDPALGHKNDQLALVLSPKAGIIYDGSITHTSSAPIQVAVLHEIDPNESQGQPIWTIDGKTIYGFSILDSTPHKSGSFEFTGAALALYGQDSDPFVSTVSVDGWIRGGAIEFTTLPKIDTTKEKSSSIDLLQSNMAIKIPMYDGIYNKDSISYIVTDTSSNDDKLAQIILEKQKWKINVAPTLSTIPDSALEEIYFFVNGDNGTGAYGFQNEVFSSTPQQHQDYSPLRKVFHVSWKEGQNPTILNSVDEIMQANTNKRIQIKETDIILNVPQIIWPDGQMQIRTDNTIQEDNKAVSYIEGGQILNVDPTSNTVTFVAHRGWGHNGQTIYYIITDATPAGPAQIMGVTNLSFITSKLTSNLDITSILFQFKNGLVGAGSLGYQPPIITSVVNSANYSPIHQVSFIEWTYYNNTRAELLQTINDINQAKSDKKITVGLARSGGSNYIINAPLVDPFLKNSKG